MLDYADSDNWTPDQVAEFKNQGRFAGPDMAVSTLSSAPPLYMIAEGDSWFDYPVGVDLIDWLRNFGYQIENFATAGDTLENMIYGTAVKGHYAPALSTIGRVIDRIRQTKPRVFLFSGGGNDVAGDEFASFLNHAESGLPDLRADHVQFMVDTVFRKCYEDLIAKVQAASPDTYLVTHGYGYTYPTGKGVWLIFRTWAGPWLLPALAMKRITDLNRQREIVRYLIDALNALLYDLSQKCPHFIYVDLRQVIDPENDWVNELHLRNSAYRRTADAISNAIQAIK